MQNRELKHMAIEDIIVDGRYRKDNGTEEFQVLVDSILSNGIIQPLTVSQSGKLLAGGRRLAAAKVVGLRQIPVLVYDCEDALDELEVELFENIHRKNMTWQEETQLVLAIHELQTKKHKGGWSGRKTAALLDRSVGGVNESLHLAASIQQIPELGKQRTKHDAQKALKRIEENCIREALVTRALRGGDDKIQSSPIQFAANHYRFGDAFEGLRETIECYKGMGMPSNIQLFEVDPPYAINLHATKYGVTDIGEYYEIDGRDYAEWLAELARLLYAAGSPNCWLIFWFGPTWFHEVKTALSAAAWEVCDIPGIWNKSRGQTMHPDIHLGNAYEPFFIARKGNPTIARMGTCNVFSHHPVAPVKKIHPTERPVELIKDILNTFVYPKSVICCPFMGSGATLMAAYELDLACFGWDLSAEYRNNFLSRLTPIGVDYEDEEDEEEDEEETEF